MSERRVLIVGSGSYVLEDAFGPQPVLRAVLQWAKANGARAALTLRTASKRAAVEAMAARAAAETGAADRLEIVALDDAPAILAARPFAVFVCVPDPAHAEWLDRAADAGVPAFVVKPLTGDRPSAERIVARGGDVWVDYHKRFDPSNLAIREAVLDRRYGDLLHYAVQYTQPRALPLDAFAWAAGTDVFTYIGCHYADQIDFLFPGAALERVSAVGVSGEVHARLSGRGFDLVVAQIGARTPDGRPLLATMQVGWCDPSGSPAKSHQRVEATFARGRIIADQKARGLQSWSDGGTAEANPYFFAARRDPVTGARAFSGYGVESVARFLDFCTLPDAARAAWRVSPTLPFAARALFAERVCDAVRRSLDAGGAWVAP